MSAGDDLRQRTASGLNWRFLTVVVQFALQFVAGVVLARLLPPEDFGLVGLALIVISFGRIVSDLGLAESLIQYQGLTRRHVRVGFTFSVALGVVVALAVYAIAPFVAAFFQDARVTDLLRFIGLSFFFLGFGITGGALLRRALAFKKLMVVELASYGLGYGAVAIVLAVLGYGPWSLAWGVLAQSIARSLLAYGFAHHSVVPLLAAKEFRELASFGVGASLQQIFNYFAREGDYAVVGRLLGDGPLGLYARAYQLMQMPLNYIGNVLSSVLFPAVSRIQDDLGRVRQVYVQALASTSLLVLPLMVGLGIFAPEIVMGLFGPGWEGTVRPLQILAIFGLFRTAYHVADSFIKATGHIYQLFAFQVIYAACVLGGSWWGATVAGIEGVAWAVGGSILVMYGLVVTSANLITNLQIGDFLRAHLPSMLLSAVFAGCCLLARQMLLPTGWHDLVVFLLGGLLAAAGTLGSLYVLPIWWVRIVLEPVAYLIALDVVPERGEAWLRRLLPAQAFERAG